MSAEKAYVELEVGVAALGEAMADLTPEQIVEVLKVLDEHSQDWAVPLAVHDWAVGRHREWEQEQIDQEAIDLGHCVRSDQYPDIQAHTDPHKECVLR